MAIDNPLYTDTLRQGTDKIVANFAQTLNKGISPSNGIFVGGSIPQIPGHFNQDVPPIEFFHYGKYGSPTGTELDRTQLPKGFVAFGPSLNIVNNWQWDNVDGRAEPYDIDFPMIGFENGGEGVLCHYTKPGSIPALSFHEITRFGGGVDGLSGVDPYTTEVAMNQFKAPIFAQYRATTTPDAGTQHPWWGGSDNAIGGVLNPLMWLSTEEVKGSGYNVNELARISAYGSASAYPVLNFEKSNGTFQTKTVVTTNSVMGEIGSNIWDGAAPFERTAVIRFTSRGTMGAGSVGQSILFLTSGSNTAGLSTRLEIGYDGQVKTYVPFRQEIATVTGVPSYGASFVPATEGSTIYNMGPLSTSSGGARCVGFTNNTATGIPMMVDGIHGHTTPTAPAVAIVGRKHDGSTAATALGNAEIVAQFRNNATVLTELLGNGNFGFLQTTPTAVVDLAAVTTSRASLRIRAGTTTTAPSSPNAGDIWQEGTNNRLMYRKNATSCEIMASVQVNTVSPTAPDRTIQLTIDGTTYYIHAKTTND